MRQIEIEVKFANKLDGKFKWDSVIERIDSQRQQLAASYRELNDQPLQIPSIHQAVHTEYLLGNLHSNNVEYLDLRSTLNHFD